MFSPALLASEGLGDEYRVLIRQTMASGYALQRAG
jgi:hypothetical protein